MLISNLMITLPFRRLSATRVRNFLDTFAMDNLFKDVFISNGEMHVRFINNGQRIIYSSAPQRIDYLFKELVLVQN